MAVIPMWKCDRDGSMFEDKKSADAHDKMLELAENITQLIEENVSTVSESDADAIGILLAKCSDALVKACKGKPEALLEASQKAAEGSDSEDSNVTAING